MKIIILILIALVFYFAIGYVKLSKEIENQITTDLLSNGRDEMFYVENFKKIDGHKKDDRTYIAMVKYDLVFKASVKELTRKIKNKSHDLSLENAVFFTTMALKMQYADFEHGDVITREEKFTLINIENGWRVNE